ncbi:MAG: hypothetical protein JW910_03630, partial [Anaerolineae bacterium]|nr:hypothetical protein [Anaerolineae bacterium]
MADTYLSLITLISAPLMVGAVVGAWTTTGRLYAARLHSLSGRADLRLPAWIPWAVAMLTVLAALVLVATQMISASTALAANGVEARSGAVLVGVLFSPAWLAGAALAVLGMVLHFVLDGWLRALPISPLLAEGIAQGVRAAWLVVGLLVLVTGLQNAAAAV